MAATLGLAAALLLAAAALTSLATGRVLRLLAARAVLDRPNARSMHTVPTPRGGGLAVLAIVLPAWVALSLADDAAPGTMVVAATTLALAAVSWHDDRRGLAIAPRLLAQLVSVAVGVAVLPGAVFQDLLPAPLDKLLAALVWLWFVNLYNFMDGIDGITGGETAVVALGTALVAAALGGYGLAWPAAVLAGAALGFLAWNWHPAKLFLGDVGSVPLGFLVGWLLLNLAAAGAWAAALILPLYYLADATLTLLGRVLRGERFWQAHRQHAYQRAVAAGLSHAAVVSRILAADVVLVALAALATAGPAGVALGAATLTVAVLLADLTRARRQRPEDR